MHIVLVTICYPPEIRSISLMMRELAEAFVIAGHRVTILTSWPQYNLSRETPPMDFRVVSDEPIQIAHGRAASVRVIRVKTLPTHKVAYVLRGIAHMDLPRRFLRAYRTHVHDRVDVVLTYISPLPLAAVGSAIAKEHGARHILNVQDIFPQNAIDLGIMRNRALIAYFERMEHAAYTCADAITTHTPGSQRFLVERKGVPQEKVSVITNWIDLASWDRVQPNGEFRRRYGLENAFIIGFPGILGPAQHLDHVLDLARRTQDVPHLRYLFVGDGTTRSHLESRVRDERIANVQFEDFVSPDRYPAFVKELDVGLVSLDSTYTTSMVPGKLTGFLAAGIPVLALLNAGNDGFDILARAGCGYACSSDDLAQAEALVRQLVANRNHLAEMGARGHAYAEAHYAKETCMRALHALLPSPVSAMASR